MVTCPRFSVTIRRGFWRHIRVRWPWQETAFPWEMAAELSCQRATPGPERPLEGGRKGGWMSTE